MMLENYMSEMSTTDIIQLFKVGKESRELGGFELKELIKLPWWFVKVELPELFNHSRLTEIIERMLDYSGVELDLYEVDVKEQMQVVIYAQNMLKQIFEMEKREFESQPDMNIIAAGGDRFNIFGEYNTLDSLAGGDITKWDAVKLISYEDSFTKLLKNKKQSEFEKDYAKVIRDKDKNKKR